MVFLHCSWLEIKGNGNFSLQTPALPACLSKISYHNTAQEREFRVLKTFSRTGRLQRVKPMILPNHTLPEEGTPGIQYESGSSALVLGHKTMGTLNDDNEIGRKKTLHAIRRIY